jgi:hypothetical protein
MDFVDPVAMTNAGLTGSMDFGGWPIVWLTLVGLLIGSGAAIAFASAPLRLKTRRPRPRLSQVGAVAALAGRTR